MCVVDSSFFSSPTTILIIFLILSRFVFSSIAYSNVKFFISPFLTFSMLFFTMSPSTCTSSYSSNRLYSITAGPDESLNFSTNFTYFVPSGTLASILILFMSAFPVFSTDKTTFSISPL